MRISSLMVGGGASLNAGQKNQIKAQIRKLEKRKDELLEKLGLSTKSSGSGFGSPSVLKALASSSFSLPAAGSGGDEESESSTASASRDLSASFQQFRQTLQTDSSAAIPEESEDPKEIMKQIMSIDMLLMTLRQQLGEEYTSKNEEEEDEEGAGTGHVALGGDAAPAEAAPAVEVPVVQAGDGHVDGYA